MNKRKDQGRGYALAFSPVLSVLRSALDAGSTSLAEIARTYRHIPGADLTRVALHEKTDDPTLWLIEFAASELSPFLTIDGDHVAYQPGLSGEDLRYHGEPVPAVVTDDPYANAHKRFGDPFNIASGRFAENIRDPGDLTELRESMRAHGWVKEFPALRDEWGVVLVGNRRLAVAKELGIEPVFQDVPLGDGDAADAKRFRLALVSNIGSKPFTPTERKRLAEYLYGDREWSQQKIAEALHVSQDTISRDLTELTTVVNSESGKRKRGRPRKLSPEVKRAQAAAAELAERGIEPTKEAVKAATGLGDTPARWGITAYHAVEEAKLDQTLQTATLGDGEVHKPKADPLRKLVFEFLDTAPRPLDRPNAVRLIGIIQRYLDDEASPG